MMNELGPSVLIVDDEDSIRKSLHGVFHDEGYRVSLAENGEAAIGVVKNEAPDVVLLDIWMPGLDGLQTLEKIREIDADIPVIMISGHATIATAVKATRMGASDFLEKPLDLDAVLLAVQRALSRRGLGNGEEVSDISESKFSSDFEVSGSIQPLVFTRKALLGEKVPQKTLASSRVIYGQGLHSGRKSGLMLEPLPANSGIHFVGVSEPTPVPALVDFVGSTGWATTIKLGQTQVATIEHLMSALHAYGISNLLIKCNGEVPVLDGSSRDFCSLIEEVGLQAQEGDWYDIKIKSPIRIDKGKELIEIVPSDNFEICYTLEYPAPIGRQEFSFVLSDPKVYKEEIAPARTFGFVKDISHLQKHGLALGGRFDNFVLIGDQGPINTEFRFSDEPIRHKILDAIGDLYLLGRRIRGRINAKMTGHSDNIAICAKILEAMKSELA